MVKITAIKQYNDSRRGKHEGLVCVFVGATSGIGASTLEKTVQSVQRSTFYILGRSVERFATQRTKLQTLNNSCNLVFIPAEVSLLSNIDTACRQIKAAEQKVDYLYMSPGLIPLNGPQYTKEGLEICFSISYYARIRLVCNLLPLLNRSSRPRVLSVLNGGREKALQEQDIGLDQHWSPLAVVNHTTTMTSLAFERLAEQHEQIAMLHAYPGLVRTDIFARLTPPESSGILWRMTLASIRGLVGMVMLFFGMPVEDCGERQAWLLSTDTYGPGAWRIDSSSEPVSEPGVLQKYREKSWSERIWEHTMRIFDSVLAVDSGKSPR